MQKSQSALQIFYSTLSRKPKWDTKNKFTWRSSKPIRRKLLRWFTTYQLVPLRWTFTNYQILRKFQSYLKNIAPVELNNIAFCPQTCREILKITVTQIIHRHNKDRLKFFFFIWRHTFIEIPESILYIFIWVSSTGEMDIPYLFLFFIFVKMYFRC